jgi:hypothetical protein
VISSFCVRMIAQLFRSFLISCVLCTFVDITNSIYRTDTYVKRLIPFVT